ncbi:putative AC transposase [Bienertia sinuspersici]
MARAVFSLFVPTIALESAFSTGGHILDGFRTSLTLRMVEALICCVDRFRSYNMPLMIEESLLELENLEEGHFLSFFKLFFLLLFIVALFSFLFNCVFSFNIHCRY